MEETKCPECKNNLIHLFGRLWACGSHECFFNCEEMGLDEIEYYGKKLTKIRHDAKQELIKEFDSEFYHPNNGMINESKYWIIESEKFNEIKKRHGVE